MFKANFTKLLLVTTTVLSFTACGGGGGSTSTEEGDSSNNGSNLVDTANKAPIVRAGDDKKVQINIPTTIQGYARDDDGTISSYEWTKGDTVLGTTYLLSYIPTTVGTETLTLTVTDDDGATSSDSMTLEIVNESVVNADNILP